MRSATTRRLRLGLGLASALVALSLAAPPEAGAESVLRATMHADVRNVDPFWTTQTITGIHAMLVYDTLFGVDDQLKPQPQMVGSYEISEDAKEYTFTLRDGLAFHDGAPVTSADAIASLKRWGAKDQAGRALMGYITAMEKVDDKTFKMILSEPYGRVVDSLGTTGEGRLGPRQQGGLRQERDVRAARGQGRGLLRRQDPQGRQDRAAVDPRPADRDAGADRR